MNFKNYFWMKNKKILSKTLFEANYVANDAEDVKKLQATGVLKKDDTVTMADDAKKAADSKSNTSSTMSLACSMEPSAPKASLSVQASSKPDAKR